MERSIHRLLAGWGRYHREIEDKAALHRHVWEQAEIIRRLRERIEQFPGGKPDDAVHPAFEKLANCALLAPSFEDAIDAVYHLLLRGLVWAYAEHVQGAHPIHDAPTIGLLHEINTFKEQHSQWYREYRRRNPHQTNAPYLSRLEGLLAAIHHFKKPMPTWAGEGSSLCGRRVDFLLPLSNGRPKGWRPKVNIMPYLSADFSESVEARRLFWAIGYFYEINLPDEQLRWLYYGQDMPWAWHRDVSRHLWDESRHGLSGYSRLTEWGVSISDVGLVPCDGWRYFPKGTPLVERMSNPCVEEDRVSLSEKMPAMSAQDLYEAVFNTGMVAESAHFSVKNESYADFRDGGDLESAEMMLFDIIDETAHVQYAHRWLPMLAEKAGIDNTGYRQRASKIRAQMQENEMKSVAEAKMLPRNAGFAPWDHYQELLARVRQKAPFKKDFKPKPRSFKPM